VVSRPHQQLVSSGTMTERAIALRCARWQQLIYAEAGHAETAAQLINTLEGDPTG
jgi:hypothetical protein